MSNYEMPAITKSQRETLIAYCISRIEQSAEYSRAGLALRIALAALTAEPADFDIEENWDKQLYVIPPVPALPVLEQQERERGGKE
ncbi:hypothetical protein [Pantoea sp.]|uniref:hypothetical protein n=1 Tax=Pantoea sp. TaxID=69393 RepID=UPI002044FE94|nr:hypothetical protein [Pantoea sp.]MDU5476249.1 hypothetical protein [Pantoea sp.]DAI70294.1 MAG TPA: hypothetical protein [Bacteriophage sp.]